MCKEYHFFKNRLKTLLEPYDFGLILLSGGLDSCLLLKVVHSILGKRVEAITFASLLQTQRCIRYARNYAGGLGINHLVIDYQPLEEEGIFTNNLKRCYLCKNRMFSIAGTQAAQRGKRGILMDGTHTGDDPFLRPGMKANTEFGIVSPWRELGFGKSEIMRLAKDLDLSIWDKPSDSCLATRFPWGYKLTKEDLGRLEAAEEFLRGLGFYDFRLRPADSPPKLLFSALDYKMAVYIGREKLWDIIREQTGWDLKDGLLEER